MATYTHNEIIVPSGVAWYLLNFEGFVGTDSLVVVSASDGTEMRIIGSDFTYDEFGFPTGGTVTQIDRTDSGGSTTYETITALNLSLVDLFSSPDIRSFFALIFADSDSFNGFSGDDLFVGGPGGDTLDGGIAGTDTVSYDNALVGVTANLANSAANTGDAAGDTYISIENLTGSDFSDSLTGDLQSNVLSGGLDDDFLDGGLSNDFLIGGAGADTLDGGSGNDWAFYNTALAGLTVDLSAPSNNTGDAEGDSYISIEHLRGSAFNDTLTGDSGNNFLRGGGGADVLNGGAGFDTADYFNSIVGLTADLGNPGNNTGQAVNDSYISIENLRGSAFDDTLHGDDGSNLLDGQVGADVLDGGEGFDYAWYGTATEGVTASLANPETNTGDAAGDSYISIEGLRGSNFDDHLTGDADSNFLRGGLGGDTLDGQGGFDWADYINASEGLIVDLSNATNNTGEAAGDSFTSIEGIRGSAFDDILIGDALLNGGTALNQFEGNLGADTLIGNGGVGNYAVYARAAAGLTVSLSNPLDNTGEAEGDSYLGINSLVGSTFDDVLIGNAASNWLVGGAGGDVLDGQGSGDRDAAAYWNAAVGLTASLANPASNTGDADGDVYSGIEGLVGSRFDDILIGDGNDNFLVGTGGGDVLNGGAGSDTASYTIFTAQVGITADLANPGNNTGEAAGDSYISIENLTGTNFDDFLFGNNSDNILRGSRDGGQGDDTLAGRGGADILIGGLGADVLDGGNGSDTASYLSSESGLIADLATPANNTGEAVGDSYVSVENLRGSEFDDILRGDSNNNTLNGGGGADVIEGGGRTDTLIGGDGVDTASYESATAGVTVSLAIASSQNTGGAGRDTLSGFESLTGSEFDDVLSGNSDANTITGGGGADRFVYAATSDSNPGTPDVIMDFVHGTDVIDLSGIDANSSLKKNQAFLIAAEDTGVVANSVTWHEDGENTIVWADATGDATAEFELVLTGTNLGLAASDFIL
jgi:Ca2+-binding RTX toxin-like protein